MPGKALQVQDYPSKALIFYCYIVTQVFYLRHYLWTYVGVQFVQKFQDADITVIYRQYQQRVRM